MNKLSSLPLQKVALFRALQIGDLLCAIPAVRAFKKAYPASNITLIGLPWAQRFVKRFPDYFSDFIHFPGYPGLPEQGFDTRHYISFLEEVNKRSFDLLIQMHGNGALVNPVAALCGAKRITGYFEPGKYCPDAELCMPYPEEGAEITKHLQLMEFLGIAAQDEQLEFPVTAAEQQSFSDICATYDLQPKQYVCVHPGARDTRRWWSAQNFAQVADLLTEKGYTVVLTGTESEYHTTQLVASSMRHEAINLTGKTDLGTLAVLIKNARMLLSNDTGVSHIASAVKTPSVVIFLASDPSRWAPLDQNRHRIILPHESENMSYVVSSTEQALLYQEAGP
jgi:ADP-heptose:LPS heptosyltransferase